MRPRHAVPRDKVINAIITLTIVRGRSTRRVGTVAVRVSYPDGIQWWHIGSSINWNEAEDIGRDLRRFMEVRIERDSD